MNEAHIEQPEDRPDHEETEPYDGVAPLEVAPEPAKVLWTKVTEEDFQIGSDAPGALERAKAEPADSRDWGIMRATVPYYPGDAFRDRARRAGDPGTSVLATRHRYTGEFGDIDEPRADASPEWTDHDFGWRVAMQPSDEHDRPTLDMGKVEPAIGAAIVWDDDEPSVGDVYGYGRGK